MSHTPGPWTMTPTGKGGQWRITALDPTDPPGDEPWRIADVHGSVGYDGGGQSAPNAHLIAAAPELLAMLQRVRETFGAVALEFADLGYDIDALLAKATGQEVGR